MYSNQLQYYRMSTTNLENQLSDLYEKYKRLKNETPTKRSTIDVFISPFFNILDYDRRYTDQLKDYKELGVNSDVVDYVGYQENSNPSFFLKCRRLKEKLNQERQIRLVSGLIKREETVHFYILTNGFEYRFFRFRDKTKLFPKPELYLSFNLATSFHKSIVRHLSQYFRGESISKVERLDIQKIKQEEIEEKTLEFLRNDLQKPISEIVQLIAKAINIREVDTTFIKKYLLSTLQITVSEDDSRKVQKKNGSEYRSIFDIENDETIGVRKIFYQYKGKSKSGFNSTMYSEVMKDLYALDIQLFKLKFEELGRTIQSIKPEHQPVELDYDTYISSCLNNPDKYDHLRVLLKAFKMKDSLRIKLKNGSVMN